MLLNSRVAAAVVTFLLLASAPGCRTTRPQHPDDLFGHQRAGFEAGRETTTIREARPGETFFVYPVVIDSVHVRHGFFDKNLPIEGQTVPVDVLVKGSFPDVCYELHALRQERYASIIRVELSMRRPRGVTCERIVRYYRYYFDLEGEYAVGHYSLLINDEPFPFQVRPLTGE